MTNLTNNFMDGTLELTQHSYVVPPQQKTVGSLAALLITKASNLRHSCRRFFYVITYDWAYASRKGAVSLSAALVAAYCPVTNSTNLVLGLIKLRSPLTWRIYLNPPRSHFLIPSSSALIAAFFLIAVLSQANVLCLCLQFHPLLNKRRVL